MTKKIILNKGQLKLLNFISTSNISELVYWTGGTAMAECYFQHRLSRDIDLFSKDLIDDITLQTFIKSMKDNLNIRKVTARQNMNRRTFDLDGLKLEIVYFPFESLKKPLIRHGVKTDSLQDIATNKLLALYQRNDPKDLFDLYFIYKNTPFKPKKLFKNVEKKFGEILEESLYKAKCEQALGKLSALNPLAFDANIFPKISKYFQNEDRKYLLSILL